MAEGNMTQTVLVTGASGGVGRAVARRFRADGATVLAGYRDDAAVEALAAMGCRPVRLEITDESDLVAAAAGDIDVLVNAAGVSQGGPLEKLPLEALRHEFEVNVIGALGSRNWSHLACVAADVVGSSTSVRWRARSRFRGWALTP
jgi:NADP-dependent 3-hydroxy acid dehydrogenase YdfG